MTESTQHSHGKGVQSTLAPLARELRKVIPDTYAGFAALHTAALAEGALPSKTKELIALAIAVVEQCDGCIAAHARGAAKAGATKDIKVGKPSFSTSKTKLQKGNHKHSDASKKHKKNSEDKKDVKSLKKAAKKQ